jgi:tripartite-type tricarboxylate transporter receptor subunit TctC
LISPNWYAVDAPRGVPDDVTRRIYQSTVRILQLPDVRACLAEFALDSVGSSPTEMAAY